MQPKRFNCQNTEGGARARGTMRKVVGQVLPTWEADAWGRAPGTTERPLPRGFPPPRERQAGEAGRGDPVESLVTHRHLRLTSGHHALRLRGERGQGSG
jgi:hypothetical protein